MKLVVEAFAKLICGALLVGLLLFLPAGTFCYPNAWLLFAILFIPMLFAGVIMLIKSPDLLKKRLDVNEKVGTQRAVVFVSAIGFVLAFVIAGLDFRFSWSYVSPVCVTVAAVLFLLGYVMYAEVLRENAYLSRTVRVEENQKVVDTGLYAFVRHPMYLATFFIFLSMPVVLGSWYSLAVFAFYPVVIVVRILSEERYLTEKLHGYKEYKQRVKYRLIPFIW